MEKDSLWKAGFGKLAVRSAQTLLILALISAVIFGLVYLSIVVIPVILATILASAIFPLVRWMGKHKISRTPAALIAILTLIGLLFGAGSLIFTSVKGQWKSLSSALNEGMGQIGEWLHSGELPISTERIDSIIESGSKYFTSASFGQGALTVSGSIVTVIAGAVLTIVILFFFLKDGDNVFKFLVSFFHTDLQTKLLKIGDRGAKVLGGYITGTTIVALIDTILIGAGLWILQVPLALPLSLLVFIGAYIPFIGATSAGVIAALTSLVTNDLQTAIIVGLIVLAVNQLEGNLIAPFVLGNALKIHPLGILLALAVGTVLGGIVGTLLAAPVTAVIWVAWKTWHEKEDCANDPDIPAELESDDEPLLKES